MNMQNAADRGGRTEGNGEGFASVVASLLALAEQVQASISLIEGELARETSIGDQDSSNVIVLDDVTPQYVRASTALHTCRASLGTALHVLIDKSAFSHEPARRSTFG
jgi:hypothetical protein